LAYLSYYFFQNGFVLGILIVFIQANYHDFIANDEWPQFTPQFTELPGLEAML